MEGVHKRTMIVHVAWLAGSLLLSLFMGLRSIYECTLLKKVLQGSRIRLLLLFCLDAIKLVSRNNAHLLGKYCHSPISSL